MQLTTLVFATSTAIASAQVVLYVSHSLIADQLNAPPTSMLTHLREQQPHQPILRLPSDGGRFLRRPLSIKQYHRPLHRHRRPARQLQRQVSLSSQAVPKNSQLTSPRSLAGIPPGGLKTNALCKYPRIPFPNFRILPTLPHRTKA